MRKKILLSLAIFFSFLQLSAQFQKKQLYFDLTGEKRIIRYSTNGLRPSVSIGLGDHSAIGVYFDYTRYKAWSYSNAQGYSDNYSVGVFYNYYRFFKGSEKWGWFASADLSFNQFNVYEKTSGSSLLNNRYNQVKLALTPGIFFKPTERIMLHADIGSLYLYHDRNEFLNVRSNFATQINVGITIGLGNKGKKKGGKSFY
jgi:hypothetical protein